MLVLPEPEFSPLGTLSAWLLPRFPYNGSLMDTTPSRSWWPLVLVITGALFVFGAAYSLINQTFASSDVIPSVVPGSSVSQSIDTSVDQNLVNNPGIPRVTPVEVKAAFEAGTAVIVDVRPADAFAQSHIPGALSIPLSDLGSRKDELNPQDWIITYCT
jgi:hypothetical protein